ncbi:hypothetical protein D8T38_01095 [Vibrio vulnificus]|nr:hypothetical protein CRN60_08065 [Vibrio vulnificus]RZQ39159.1 hypothetical protein D8T38_01095 [Vibrio vulnificus]RZQ79380.1 hypothetical protein D8T22_05105 [Vibrio vulnificus]RZR18397.1 hypothetical protein D8T44_00990 [Vibrio vulnificus]
MDPRLREDDKQKTKETSKQENVWEGVEYFCLQKACRTTDANSAQIRFHYRATPTIAVILANAGIHLPARTEHGVGISTHSGKHLQTQKQRPPLSSFSRTRESIYPRAPSSVLEKVLTAENIYKRRNSVPHYRHSRGRGNPFTRVHRAVRWRKCLQRQTFQMPREQGEYCRTINSQCTL